MLSKFFHCQWMQGNQDDWTEQVKCDLRDLGLPCELKMIRKKSNLSWKNLVKKKAKEFEFKKQITLKETKNASKLGNITYSKLELQEYLTKLDVNLSKNVFKFRVKMANFGGNYKGQGPTEICPLCKTHSDFQELCFLCPTITSHIQLTEDYENIFKPNISNTLARNLLDIIKIRMKTDDQAEKA